MIRPGRAFGAACSQLALGAVATLGCLLCGAGPAAAAGTSPSALEQAIRYWTPARMQEAKPMDLPAPRFPRLDGSGRERGAPGTAAARAAQAGAPGEAVTFDEVADPTTAQLRRNGVVFFLVDDIPARCSGTAVSAPDRSVVFTAGHCVVEPGRRARWFSRFWVFVPGFRFGQRPFGVFPATRLDSTGPWISTGSEDADVGAAVVGRNERGQLLGEAVGGDGIAWNRPARQVFDVHGYPAAPPFDGETQRLCSQTPFLGHDSLSFLMQGPLNLAVSCNVTGGASGGGWTIEGDTLNSVTDYGYPLDPGTDYGSYFGEDVARLYGRVSGG